MSDLVFPSLPGLSWSIMRTPIFGVQLRTADSQREVTEIIMNRCYYSIELSFEMLRQGGSFTELDEIEGLFLAMRGSYDYFKFTDPNSNTIINGQIGTGNGTNTTFIIGRNTGPSYFEAIGFINQLTDVKVNGVTVSPSTYTLSFPNVITFNTPPPSGRVVTVTCTYYYLCRFGEDQHEYEQFMYRLHQLNQITLKTVDY
jgi:uncharacterized protein (TIGR02217 family)